MVQVGAVRGASEGCELGIRYREVLACVYCRSVLERDTSLRQRVTYSDYRGYADYDGQEPRTKTQHSTIFPHSLI